MPSDLTPELLERAITSMAESARSTALLAERVAALASEICTANARMDIAVREMAATTALGKEHLERVKLREAEERQARQERRSATYRGVAWIAAVLRQPVVVITMAAAGYFAIKYLDATPDTAKAAEVVIPTPAVPDADPETP